MRRLWIVLALAAAAGLWSLWAFGGSRTAVAEEEWAQVQRQDLVVGIETTGTLGAVQSVEIGPPQLDDVWDYKIAFLAPEGSEVRQGQPVLGFDTSNLENTLLETMAERDSAQKELEKKQANLEMTRDEDELRLAEAKARARRAGLKVDVPADLVASKELAESRADLQLAQREIAYLENRLSLQSREAEAETAALRNKRDRAAWRVRRAEEAIGRMTVVAPRDGTVVYLSDNRRGREKKKIGDGAWRGEKILEIPDLRQMRADGEVDEADAGRVAMGQRVVFRLDAHPDVIFTGRVRAIQSAVQTRSQNDPVKVVGLDLSLDQTDPQRMRPGMRFSGTVELDRVPRALVVAAETVFNRPAGPTVFRRTRWGVEEVHPKLGRRNDRWVEIVSGLAEGDAIALRDPEAVE
jgi:multidrug efflux pump subunit AcrA (membrane-fusion protein)